MTHIQSKPLRWPHGWPRTQASSRKKSNFHKHSEVAAANFICSELEKLKVDSGVIAADTVLRGLPDDPGVAVYFTIKGKQLVLACDNWVQQWENLWAIGKHIEALRGQHRWGVGSVDQAFAGYAALTNGPRDWHQVLGVSEQASAAEIAEAYRQKAKLAHPDVLGGSQEKMVELNSAYAQARIKKGWLDENTH